MGTSENLFLEATNYGTKTKTQFNISNFLGDFNEVQKKSTGYVMRTLGEWQKLVPKGEDNLMPMPFIIRRTKRPTYSCWHYKICNILDTAKRT